MTPDATARRLALAGMLFAVIALILVLMNRGGNVLQLGLLSIGLTLTIVSLLRARRGR